MNRTAVNRTAVNRVLTGAVLAGCLLLSSGASALASPAQDSFPEAALYSVVHPEATLPGVNDYTCTPTAAHPEPVVLVHGFLENSYVNWASLGPALAAEGYCVFAIDYGELAGVPVGGFGSIADGAAGLAVFVDEVRHATGASTVALVGHSKGGTIPRYYVRFLGGSEHVSQIVALSPPNYPTPGPPVDEALERLNVPTDTVPGVRYTTIVTRYDQVVPYTASLLTGPGAHNIVLQDLCPGNTVEHTGISYDGVAQQLVLAALQGEIEDGENTAAVNC